MPTDDALTGEEFSIVPPIGAPSFAVPGADDDGEFPLPGDDGAPRELSARTGIVGLIIVQRVRMVGSG